MHGIIKDTTEPLVYSLMRSKTKEKYEELFAALNNLNAMLDPHEVTIDFEIAAIEAIKSSFHKLKETTAKMQNEKTAEFLNYFEATWLGEKNSRGGRTGASFLPQIWKRQRNAPKQ